MSEQRPSGGPGLAGLSTGVPGRNGPEGQGPSGKPFAISKEEVRAAWEKVRANKGAPGVDEVSIAESGGTWRTISTRSGTGWHREVTSRRR
jgi:hypothetical protein